MTSVTGTVMLKVQFVDNSSVPLPVTVQTNPPPVTGQ